MDVLHDAFFHTEDNYKCMTSGEELSKFRLNAKRQMATKAIFEQA